MSRDEFRSHLLERLLPFWEKLRDGQYGGYYGWMDSGLEVDRKAVKGCILNSRILWFFSNALFGKAQADPVLCHMLLTRTLSRLALEHALPEKRIPPYLADMKARLEAHYCENCALADLERRYHVNRYRLCREFKLHYQTSPLQYLHKMRVQAAITLLTQTPMKVHEISYEVGYENVNHFIAHFKKNIGMTPTEYRQQGLPFPADL